MHACCAHVNCPQHSVMHSPRCFCKALPNVDQCTWQSFPHSSMAVSDATLDRFLACIAAAFNFFHIYSTYRHDAQLVVPCAALALGTALSKALGDRKGIHRFGDFTAPLDEALVHVVLVWPSHNLAAARISVACCVLCLCSALPSVVVHPAHRA